MRTRLALVPALLAVAVGVGACSGGSGGGNSSAGEGAADSAGARASSARAAAPANAGGSVAGRGGVAKVPAATTPLAAAKIRTVEMAVAVRGASRVAQQADRAEDIAVTAGGEVDGDDRTGGRSADATLRLRVPPEQLRGVLKQLSRLGTERERSSSTVDVSEKVADISARVTSARAAIARLRGLYATATKVADVLAVEDQLSQREADLESLEAQQRTLARQTQMASITLSLSTLATTAPVRHHPDRYAGFVGGLRRGWDAFLTAARGIGTAAGAILPFLVIVLALALVARWLGWRVPRRHRAPPVTE